MVSAARSLPLVLALLGMLSLVAGLYAWQHASWAAVVVAGALALVSAGGWRSVRPLRHAVMAAAVAVPRPASVRIRSETWSDAVHWHAQVRCGGAAAQGARATPWQFEFIPQGWQPEEGEFAAWLYALPGQEVPALVSVDAGLLIPRDIPKSAA